MIKLKHFLLLYLAGFNLLAVPCIAENHFPKKIIFHPEADMYRIELGQLLFYDPILSGNKKVSCASCHHPRFGTSDGLSLGLGDGANGLGSKRKIDQKNIPELRVARNSPALFNLGATQYTSLFHDGRLEINPQKPGGLRTPLGAEMVSGFSGLLSAQAMFPVLSPDEMAGHYSENDISKAVRLGRLTHAGGAWEIITSRVESIAQYREAFEKVLGPEDQLNFADIANVIADFIAFEWRADNSPFDQYLNQKHQLSPIETRGMNLFYGKASCATCHSGLLQTDHQFHAIAMPQFGPGKSERFENHQRDLGRFRVTGKVEDVYKFRTPSLRNISLTAPYGHTGAYSTLEAVIRHHINPVASLKAYQRDQATLPILEGAEDWNIMNDTKELSAIAAANELKNQRLTETEITSLVAFLNSLTDQISLQGRLGIPDNVPSGLLVEK